MTTVQKKDDSAWEAQHLAGLVLCLVSLVVVVSILAMAVQYKDWQFVTTFLGSIAVSAVVLYGIKWWVSPTGGVRWWVAYKRHRKLRKERVTTRKG